MARRTGEFTISVLTKSESVRVSIHYTDQHVPDSTTVNLDVAKISKAITAEFPPIRHKLKLTPGQTDIDNVWFDIEIEGGCKENIFNFMIQELRVQLTRPASGLHEI